MSKTTGILFQRGNDKELRERSDWNELPEDEKKELLLEVKIHCADGFGKLEWFETESLYPPDKYWDGEIEIGVPHGQGTFYVPESYNPVVEFYNGSKFVGTFYVPESYNLVVEFYNGSKFVGTYKNGKRQEGTYTCSRGNKYIGTYKDNKRWNGAMIYVDGNENSKYVNRKSRK